MTKEFQRHLSFVISLISLFLLSSCSQNQHPMLEIRQFEKSFFACNDDSINSCIEEWNADYSEFFPVFTEYVIRIGKVSDPGLSDFIKQFRNDPVIRQVYKLTQDTYPDFESTAQIIGKAIQRYQKEIGNNQDIRITSFISGFNQSFLTLKDELAIGIDNYLGANCNYYSQLGIPEYVYEKMSPGYLPADALRAWIMSDMDEEPENNSLLQQMIREGKILYAVREVLNKFPEHLIFKYTDEELAWCHSNEKIMWEFIVGKELLFSTDRLIIKRFTKEAPFTRDFGNNSPGRTGNWIGYRIVKRFMEKTNCSMSDLLFNKKASDILAGSGYRPKTH